MWNQLLVTFAIYPILYLVLCIAVRGESHKNQKSRQLKPLGCAIRLAIVFALFIGMFMPAGIHPGLALLIFSALPILTFDLFGYFGLLGLPTIFVADWVAHGKLFGHAGSSKNQTINETEHPSVQRTVVSGLVGKFGKALTVLRPIGQVVIDQKAYEARAESGMILNGASIRVIDKRGPELIVREELPTTG
ncbi:hypothetical protein OT109_01110 [Phycisphaeraceae bacterium D3-23]